jgi:hypothetical protein
MSSTTSTGFVDTVVVGSAVVSAYYLMAGAGQFPIPPVTTLSAMSTTGTYGWAQYAGSIDFTAGYWLVTITSFIIADSTSTYYPYASVSNLVDFQMGLALDPAMTTVPGTSTPYNFATDYPYYINGSTEIINGDVITSGSGGNLSAPTGTGWMYYPAATPTGTIESSLPTFTTYVNVPSDITYYIMGAWLFSTTSTDITAYNQCAFSNAVNWNATRLSNPIPETTMPYSSYFAPVTATPTGSGGAAAAPTVPTGASSYKKAGFYGGGNVYGQYY